MINALRMTDFALLLNNSWYHIQPICIFVWVCCLCSEVFWPARLRSPSLVFVLRGMAYQLLPVCVDQFHLAELALRGRLVPGRVIRKDATRQAVAVSPWRGATYFGLWCSWLNWKTVCFDWSASPLLVGFFVLASNLYNKISQTVLYGSSTVILRTLSFLEIGMMTDGLVDVKARGRMKVNLQAEKDNFYSAVLRALV